MASFTYTNGSVSVTSTAAVVLTVTPGQVVQLQNTGTVPIFLGGSTVTASGANVGYSLANGASLNLPPVAEQPHVLYGITASTASTLVYLTSH
jgi:hypothetical protein